MNNTCEKWKCPNCDTYNTGGRCVVCGQKQQTINLSPHQGGLKSTLLSRGKSNKRTLVLAVAIVIVLLIIVALSTLLLQGEKEEQTSKTKEDITNKIEIESLEKKPEVLSDFLFDKNLSNSIDLSEINVNPGFEEISNQNITYIFPKNFENIGTNGYMAIDKTAYLHYGYDEIGENETPESIVKKRKAFFGNNVDFEELIGGQYVISLNKDEIFYCEKGLISDDRTVRFTFIFPSQYKVIYDSYIKILEEGLKLPDTSGVEVIEE